MVHASKKPIGFPLSTDGDKSWSHETMLTGLLLSWSAWRDAMKPWNFIQVSFSKMCHDLSYKALVTRDTKWNIFPKVKKVIQQPHGRENVTEWSFLIEKPYLIYLEGMPLLMPQQILQQRENWGQEIAVCSRRIDCHGDTFYGCDQIRGYQACSAGPIISRGQSRPREV